MFCKNYFFSWKKNIFVSSELSHWIYNHTTDVFCIKKLPKSPRGVSYPDAQVRTHTNRGSSSWARTDWNPCFVDETILPWTVELANPASYEAEVPRALRELPVPGWKKKYWFVSMSYSSSKESHLQWAGHCVSVGLVVLKNEAQHEACDGEAETIPWDDGSSKWPQPPTPKCV